MLWATQLGIVALSRSWCEIFLWKTGDTQKKRRRKKKKNIFAMRTVEFNQAMSGREGAQ
jgi:hypothetical protein